MPAEPSLKLGLFGPLMLLKFSLRSQLCYSSLTVTFWPWQRHFCPRHLFIHCCQDCLQNPVVWLAHAALCIFDSSPHNKQKIHFLKTLIAILILWIIFHLLSRDEVQDLISPHIAHLLIGSKILPLKPTWNSPHRHT